MRMEVLEHRILLDGAQDDTSDLNAVDALTGSDGAIDDGTDNAWVYVGDGWWYQHIGTFGFWLQDMHNYFAQEDGTGTWFIYNFRFEQWDLYQQWYWDGAFWIKNTGLWCTIYNDNGYWAYDNYSEDVWWWDYSVEQWKIYSEAADIYWDGANFWADLGGNWYYQDQALGGWLFYYQGSVSVDLGGAHEIYLWNGSVWAAIDCTLWFNDDNYAGYGTHSTFEFRADLYDGLGYDGEPIHYDYSISFDPVTGLLDRCDYYIIGDWTEQTLVHYFINNPRAALDYEVWNGNYQYNESIDVLFTFDASNFLYVQDYTALDVRIVQYTDAAFNVSTWLYYNQLISYGERAWIDSEGILEHGGENSLSIGTDRITSSNDDTFAWAFLELSEILDPLAQLQLWTCSLAGDAGSSGRELVTDLALWTGATVFASSDLTAIVPVNYTSTGDWTLEFATTGAGQVSYFWIDWIWDTTKLNPNYRDLPPDYGEIV